MALIWLFNVNMNDDNIEFEKVLAASMPWCCIFLILIVFLFFCWHKDLIKQMSYINTQHAPNHN